MTKTLTEQWSDGTLPERWYYVVRERDDEILMLYFEGDYFLDTDVPIDSENIKEVLAPVPSYDEYQTLLSDQLAKNEADEINAELLYKIAKLKNKLSIAKKALKEYDNGINWDIRGVSFMKYSKGFVLARKAIREMEGIK